MTTVEQQMGGGTVDTPRTTVESTTSRTGPRPERWLKTKFAVTHARVAAMGTLELASWVGKQASRVAAVGVGSAALFHFWNPLGWVGFATAGGILAAGEGQHAFIRHTRRTGQAELNRLRDVRDARNAQRAARG